MDATPHYGIADLGSIAHLSGLEFLQAILAGQAPQAPISRTLTFWLIEASLGVVTFEGDPSPEFFNPMGAVHGGWALTLIDSAAGCAGLSVLEAGQGYTTLETKANFTRPISPETGRVRCVGRILTKGRTILTSSAEVMDGSGRVLAHGASTLLVMNRP